MPYNLLGLYTAGLGLHNLPNQTKTSCWSFCMCWVGSRFNPSKPNCFSTAKSQCHSSVLTIKLVYYLCLYIYAICVFTYTRTRHPPRRRCEGREKKGSGKPATAPTLPPNRRSEGEAKGDR